jgi:hypothetical protein
VSIGVKRGKNRVVFTYDLDTREFIGSIQRKVGRSKMVVRGSIWEGLREDMMICTQ